MKYKHFIIKRWKNPKENLDAIRYLLDCDKESFKILALQENNLFFYMIEVRYSDKGEINRTLLLPLLPRRLKELLASGEIVYGYKLNSRGQIIMDKKTVGLIPNPPLKLINITSDNYYEIVLNTDDISYKTKHVLSEKTIRKLIEAGISIDGLSLDTSGNLVTVTVKH